MVLKLKTQDFKLRPATASSATRPGSRTASSKTGVELLRKETDGTKFRLLGIVEQPTSPMTQVDPPDLVDVQSRKRAMAEGAIDALRDKFGRKAVETGYTFGRGRDAHPPEPLED